MDVLHLQLFGFCERTGNQCDLCVGAGPLMTLVMFMDIVGWSLCGRMICSFDVHISGSFAQIVCSLGVPPRALPPPFSRPPRLQMMLVLCMTS